MRTTISVDVGGTFTDCVVIRDNEILRGKSPTTPHDNAVGTINSIKATCEAGGVSFEETIKNADMIRYATTSATNMLVERTGDKLGLITTAGNEHMIAIGRSRSWADGLPINETRIMTKVEKPEPLIPVDLTVGVKERIDYKAEVLMQLSEEEARESLKNLVDQGVEGIVVCLLWSCINGVHEQLIKKVAERDFPNIPISISSEVCPKWHEYPRANVTILSAYLGPSMVDHFSNVENQLQSYGYKRPIFIVNNAGGVGRIQATRPVDTCRSGPVAGLLGSAYLGKVYGFDNIITTDMGGTSFDLGVIVDGVTPFYVWRPVIDRWLTELSILEVKIIGAGGGSIAWINRMLGNRLEVGPQSAGAVPGPACYGAGGDEPTVTDADVVLGYIDPDYFLGGKIKLDKEKSIEVIQKKIADPLKMDLYEAAEGIRRVIDAKMGSEIYKETVLKGRDPREFVMFAFGGAGATHCCGYNSYIGVVGVPKIVSFPFAPEYCALGGETIDATHLFEKSTRIQAYHPGTNTYLSDYEGFNNLVGGLQEEARKTLGEEGFEVAKVAFSLELDMRFGVQVYFTRILSPRMFLKSEADIRAVCDFFVEEYRRIYSEESARQEAGMSIENFCLRAVVPLPKPEFQVFEFIGEDPKKAFKGTRKVYWENGFKETPVYEHQRLECGNVVKGPAIIESVDTTYVVPQGQKFTIDKYLNGVTEQV